MKLTCRLSVSLLVFVIAALVGPLLRWLTWPPGKFGLETSPYIGDFVYDLVFLLWPTQSLAVVEASIGWFFATTIAVSANVALFGIVGVISGVLAKRSRRLLVLYAVTCTLLILFEAWGASFGLGYINFLAVLVAVVLYAIPFWAVARLESSTILHGR